MSFPLFCVRAVAAGGRAALSASAQRGNATVLTLFLCHLDSLTWRVLDAKRPVVVGCHCVRRPRFYSLNAVLRVGMKSEAEH